LRRARSASKGVTYPCLRCGLPAECITIDREQYNPGEDSLAEPTGWRSETLARIRTLVQQADPDIVEEVRWRKPSNGMLGVPVWSHAGIICTGETYKTAVKITFAKGASLPDPSGLFNSSLDGNTRRAIDFQ